MLVNQQTIEFEKSDFSRQRNINKNKILNQIQSLDKKLLIIEAQSDQYIELMSMYIRELGLGEVSIMDFKNLIKDIYAQNRERELIKIEKQILINSYNYWNF